jgi:hypothetical protein
MTHSFAESKMSENKRMSLLARLLKMEQYASYLRQAAHFKPPERIVLFAFSSRVTGSPATKSHTGFGISIEFCAEW